MEGNKLFGSFKLKAKPIRFATGPSVIYLLLIFKFITVLLSFFKTIPSSMLPVASDPLFGPVKPKHGIYSPVASFGRKLFFCLFVP